ncbi:hypothetical protein [Kitasatospora sp. NPDC004531]
MIRFRTAAAAVLTLSLAGPLAPGPAAFAATRPDSPLTTQAWPSSQPGVLLTAAEDRVNRFFTDYRNAILHGAPEAARMVRLKYLTKDLNDRLDQWAAEYDADPVFRAQNVPASWTLAQGGSGAGHTTVLLTERWADGSTIPVEYQLRLPDLVIDDLENAPS